MMPEDYGQMIQDMITKNLYVISQPTKLGGCITYMRALKAGRGLGRRPGKAPSCVGNRIRTKDTVQSVHFLCPKETDAPSSGSTDRPKHDDRYVVLQLQ
jgi:hypothetical protein